jgi:hypothetical protein
MASSEKTLHSSFGGQHGITSPGSLPWLRLPGQFPIGCSWSSPDLVTALLLMQLCGSCLSLLPDKSRAESRGSCSLQHPWCLTQCLTHSKERETNLDLTRFEVSPCMLNNVTWCLWEQTAFSCHPFFCSF